MARKEKNYGLDTVGGRIQALMKENGVTREELYLAVRPEAESAPSDSSSVSTMIRGYLSSRVQLSYEQIVAVCRLLGCSSDYLLGLDEYTAKENKDIEEITGLSDQSIEILKKLNRRDKRCGPPKKIGLIDRILRTKEVRRTCGLEYMLAKAASLGRSIEDLRDSDNDNDRAELRDLYRDASGCFRQIEAAFDRITEDIKRSAVPEEEYDRIDRWFIREEL